MVSKLKMVLLFVAMPMSSLFAQDQPELHVGGALRFNYNLSSWKEGQQKRGGDFGYDLFRINVKASYKGVKLDAEYRNYSDGFGGGMLKQGWIGYDFTPENNLQIGLTQVPFGITQYNSHNWFFGLNYYIGLEDDHDMGVKYTHSDENWMYAVAFFKNAEELNFGSNSDVSNSRYSYDVGSLDGEYRNKEENTLNVKVARKFKGSNSDHMLGVSAQYGGIYNLDTEEIGNNYALAAHYEVNVGGWNAKAQVSNYKYNTKNPDGQSNDVVAMTAYGAPYLVASEATTYTLGVAYTLPVKWGPISSLQFYDDFGYMDKRIKDFYDTYMNVTGVLVSAGNVYTYIDLAQGKNHPWIGPVWTDALAAGTADAKWETRFNINIGYYF
ncbi:hypothetical protein OU798_24065 [Prolixibacteraceae bacterium Z1-6]|uniref:Porin n=1 Tax=Draconibacterium aestuarii TaxID=2998507 RepID=A0A9X3J779_9BACT|nr:hypothetical protein [Prolixibacteraceae bacterium Z1-6]